MWSSLGYVLLPSNFGLDSSSQTLCLKLGSTFSTTTTAVAATAFFHRIRSWGIIYKRMVGKFHLNSSSVQKNVNIRTQASKNCYCNTENMQKYRVFCHVVVLFFDQATEQPTNHEATGDSEALKSSSHNLLLVVFCFLYFLFFFAFIVVVVFYLYLIYQSSHERLSAAASVGSSKTG